MIDDEDDADPELGVLKHYFREMFNEEPLRFYTKDKKVANQIAELLINNDQEVCIECTPRWAEMLCHYIRRDSDIRIHGTYGDEENYKIWPE